MAAFGLRVFAIYTTTVSFDEFHYSTDATWLVHRVPPATRWDMVYHHMHPHKFYAAPAEAFPLDASIPQDLWDWTPYAPGYGKPYSGVLAWTSEAVGGTAVGHPPVFLILLGVIAKLHALLADAPGPLLMMGRWLNALFGTVTVALVFFFCRQWWRPDNDARGVTIGLVAAALVARWPVTVGSSILVYLESAVAFFFWLGAIAFLRLIDRDFVWRRAMVVGLCLGFMVATKQTGLAYLLIFPVLFLMRRPSSSTKDLFCFLGIPCRII